MQESWLRRALSLELLDNRYPALHGLRVFAIVSVVQFHVTWIFAGEQGIALDRDWTASSLTVFFGMDLFFVLSGFLIGSILMRSLEKDGQQHLKRFYIRRVSRTFPAYYIVLTYLALTTSLTEMQRAHLPFEYVYATNLVSLRRDDIVMFWGWSLALEEQFYLLAPVLFFVLWRTDSRRTRLVILVLVWLAALFARLYVYLRYRPWSDLALYEALYFRPLTRFDTLVAGIILAYVHAFMREQVVRFLADPFRRGLVALGSLSCLWLLVRPDMFGADYVQLVHVFAWGTVTSLMYFGFLLLLLYGDGFIQRNLSRPIFRRIATLGYGVYLVHIPLCDHVIVPIARTLDQRHVSMVIVWPASLALLMIGSLAMAYVIHVLIEKPSLWVRERLAG
jgi:peptidoglycan/LPS O-acetylase OafA/YrhL